MSRTIDLHSRFLRAATCAALIALGLWLSGCVTQPKKDPYRGIIGGREKAPPRPPPIDPTAVPTRDDIVSIRIIWGDLPWIFDADNRAIGVKALTYFVSAETERGSFVDGTISAALYRVDITRGGRSQRTLLHEWRFDRREALGHRLRRKYVMGYAYGMMLVWPETLDLIGRPVEFVFTYERRDGHMIGSGRKRLRVPAPAGYRPAARGG